MTSYRRELEQRIVDSFLVHRSGFSPALWAKANGLDHGDLLDIRPRFSELAKGKRDNFKLVKTDQTAVTAFTVIRRGQTKEIRVTDHIYEVAPEPVQLGLDIAVLSNQVRHW